MANIFRSAMQTYPGGQFVPGFSHRSWISRAWSTGGILLVTGRITALHSGL
jgi:hypothetical protein